MKLSGYNSRCEKSWWESSYWCHGLSHNEYGCCTTYFWSELRLCWCAWPQHGWKNCYDSCSHKCRNTPHVLTMNVLLALYWRLLCLMNINIFGPWMQVSVLFYSVWVVFVSSCIQVFRYAACSFSFFWLSWILLQIVFHLFIFWPNEELPSCVLYQ